MDYLSLCLICKDENDYLPEWLDYHILMGVDRFYIYDNESRVSLREALKEYIERGWAVVVNIPGKAMQLYAYDHCLQTFGSQTFWLGFIDTDEFLVPRTTLDLKEILREYEQYAGLAVSSLFFGSNVHKTRPVVGQIAGYTRRTHETFRENEWVKSIVQPGLTLMPNSPHDFIYKENAWCVNEGYLRVDYQRFPNHIEKIQLNHYYCRSESEIDQKLHRGNSGAISWPRRMFDAVNLMSTYQDTTIKQNLGLLFQQVNTDPQGPAGSPQAVCMLEKMMALARNRFPTPITREMAHPCDANNFRAEFVSIEEFKAQTREGIKRKDYFEARRLHLLRMQMIPNNVLLYVELALISIDLNDAVTAWQALTRAWELSPDNNYTVLGGMAFYFLQIENYSMAENTCQLILGLAPHNISLLGMLTHSLIGQGRYEEALKIGVPVVELSAQLGELPERMGISLVKKMADYLLEKKDYAGAVSLWEAGVKCQQGDVNVLLELSRILLLGGNKTEARNILAQALSLAPENEQVLALIKQHGVEVHHPSREGFHRRIKNIQ